MGGEGRTSETKREGKSEEVCGRVREKAREGDLRGDTEFTTPPLFTLSLLCPLLLRSER